MTEAAPVLMPDDQSRLELFMAALGGDKIHIGIRESLMAHDLFERSAGKSIPLTYVRAMFASLLARNPDEQRRISEFFDRIFLNETVAPPEPPELPPPELPLKRMREALQRLDPAWLATALSLAAALAIVIWVISGRTDVTIVKVNPVPVTVTKTNPINVVPQPSLADGVWTPDLLMQDMDRLMSEGKLSAAPTLNEIRIAGWPPRDLTGTVAPSLPLLVNLTGLPAHEPLDLSGTFTRDHLLNAFSAYGVKVETPAYVMTSPGQEFLTLLRRELGLTRDATRNATLQAGAEVAVTKSRPDRIRMFRELLGSNLPPISDGFDPDDLVDRRFFLMFKSANLPETAFADASWRQPPAAAALGASSWIRPAAAALPVMVLALWFLGRSNTRRSYLRPPSAMRDDPLDLAAIISAPDDVLLKRTDKALMAGVARSLNIRQHVAKLPIDPEQTVYATIARGGLFVPVEGEITSSPAYLVLVEAKNGFDQEARRLDSLVMRLENAGLALVRYFYFDSPALLQSAWDAIPEPIENIAARHNDRRLIVLGEGVGFLKPLSLEPQPWARVLMQWPDRAMLTPRPIGEWAAEDFAIARELNMPLGRATIEGLMGLAGLLGLEGRTAAPASVFRSYNGGKDIWPMSAIIRSRPHYWTTDLDPDEGEESLRQWPKLDTALRTYLDPPGMLWLAALAIYPALQWDLTIYLGRKLELSGRELYAEPRLAALTRLPWLREGQMPEWLRKHLIASLPATVRVRTIELIWEIIKSEVGDEDSGAVVRLKKSASRFVSYEGQRPGGDQLFVATMTDADGFPLPSRFRPGLTAQLADFARYHWLNILAACVVSAVAWRVAPDAADKVLARGAYMPLTLLFGLSALVWVGTRLADGSLSNLLSWLAKAMPDRKDALKKAIETWNHLRGLPSLLYARLFSKRAVAETQEGPQPSSSSGPLVFVSRLKPYVGQSGSVEDALLQRGILVNAWAPVEMENLSGIRNAVAFLQILTRSELSSAMMAELREAIANQLPIYIARIDNAGIPAMLTSVKYELFDLGESSQPLNSRELDRLAEVLKLDQRKAAA